MALVILSSGKMTESKIRTMSVRRLMVVGFGAVLLAAGGGVALGYHLAGDTDPAPVAPENGVRTHFLMSRVGELAGRLVRLESDAASLGKRIGVLKDFEARRQHSREMENVGPKPPHGASGGPLVPIPPNGQLPRVDPSEQAMEPLHRDVRDHVSRLEDEFNRISRMMAEIDKATAEKSAELMAFPSRVPIPDARRSSGFGPRVDPFTGHSAFHTGQDFAAPLGTPIQAAGGGRVIFAGWRHDYGFQVEIDHGEGLRTRYSHCSHIYVKVGDIVVPGQRIAAVGTTGRSTGPHLHFEVVLDGQYVNPSPYVFGAS